MPRSEKRIKVLIADDHPLYRSGISSVIKQDPRLELVGEAEDGQSALDAIRKDEPDVAVLDLAMPVLDGLDVLRAVTRDALATKVLVVSAISKSDAVYEAIAVGAKGYMAKTEGGKAICEAILRISRGEVLFPPEFHAGLAEQIKRHAPAQETHLTPREHEILELIGKGATTPQIAERLYLSRATVKTHVQHIFEKLGVGDRAAAIMEATRRGLLE